MRRLVKLLTIFTAILFLVISSAAFSGCAAKTNAKTKTDGKAVSESISKPVIESDGKSIGESVSEPVIEPANEDIDKSDDQNPVSFDIPADAAAIEEGTFPEETPIIMYGWLNHASGRYAAAHENVALKLKELRVLCVGNSHTDDYTYYLQDMLDDLEPQIRTKVSFTKAPMVGGRHLCYYMDEGEEYDPECYLKIWTDPDHPEYETYKKLFSQEWDLIVIQDWHESTNTPDWKFPGGAPFAEALGKTVSVLRELAPGAQIAWFADWVDSENVYEREILYQDSVDAMKASAGLPDYIIPASTVLANARTSYLGKTRNPVDALQNNYVAEEDRYIFSDFAKEEIVQYPLLSRDATHLSLELGRYLIGEAVLAHILNWYGEKIWMADGEALTTEKVPSVFAQLHTDPVWEMEGAHWKGEMTPELRGILLEAVYASLVLPQQITSVSEEFQTDPMHAVLQSMEEYMRSLELDFSMTDEELQNRCRDPKVIRDLSMILGSDLSEEQIRVVRGTDGKEVSIYIDCHIGYSFCTEPVLSLNL